MKTVRLSMAQALLRFLDHQYVEVDGEEHKFVQGVMGIFGHGNVLGIGEALENGPEDLKFIQGKNEQGMVHAATAYAKQKNRLEMFACTSSIGPGAMNMVTAAAVASVNRIPVLLLPGDIFAGRQPDPVLQQIEDFADYTISANDAFKPVSKYWDRITRPEQLMTAALNAMRVLTDPAETGAVTLALPQDVQTEVYDYPERFFEKRVYRTDRRAPSDTAVERAVSLIRSKKKPLLIAGGGVHYSLATESLREMAEAFQIPVGETQAGKSALSWDHPLNLGAIGVTGTKAANLVARDADLVIGVGTRLADFTTSSKSAFQNPDVEFLTINVNTADAAKMGSEALVGDAMATLDILRNRLAEKDYQTSYRIDEIENLKSDWDQEVDRLYGAELADGLSQTRVLGEVNRFIDDRDVIVCAAGSLPGDLHRLWRSKHPKTYHLEYGFSCMGYEVPGAFGIKMAEPDNEVYALVGDGSYLMLHSELLTSLQEGVKINIVLFDNHGFQCIHGLQCGNGSNGFGNEFRYRTDDKGLNSGDYLPIDFAAHAASLGAKTFTARTTAELNEALRKAKESTVSTLIDVKVLPGTGTDNYESWWRVDVPEVSENEKVRKAHKDSAEQLQHTRPY